MVIAFIGESCTGKSTVAEILRQTAGASLYAGQDYLRLASGEAEALSAFRALLAEASEDSRTLIYIITEKEQLVYLPAGAKRVVFVAELDTILSRFAKRTQGTLPPAVSRRLTETHGRFDQEPCDLLVHGDQESPQEIAAKVLAL